MSSTACGHRQFPLMIKPSCKLCKHQKQMYCRSLNCLWTNRKYWLCGSKRIGYNAWKSPNVNKGSRSIEKQSIQSSVIYISPHHNSSHLQALKKKHRESYWQPSNSRKFSNIQHAQLNPILFTLKMLSRLINAWSLNISILSFLSCALTILHLSTAKSICSFSLIKRLDAARGGKWREIWIWYAGVGKAA